VNDAEIGITGGGSMGCSPTFHLAKPGKSNVVPWKRGKPTSDNTRHIAGWAQVVPRDSFGSCPENRPQEL
jgi:glycine/D-amino acid oxidase-like deaminating enzyme